MVAKKKALKHGAHNQKTGRVEEFEDSTPRKPKYAKNKQKHDLGFKSKEELE